MNGAYRQPELRNGFTVLEILAVLGCLSIVLVVLAEIGLLSAHERMRGAQRQDALEAAINILEEAQAARWDALTPAWADERRLPGSLAQWLDQGRLTVRVEAEAARPALKKVTVQIDWRLTTGTAARPVVFSGWFAERMPAATGGQP